MKTLRQFSFIQLAFTLLAFPSLQYQLQLQGDVAINLYGFPLPWNADSLATSMAKDIFLLPLTVNFALLCLFSIWLLNRLKLGKFGIALIWAFGLLAVAACTLYFSAANSSFLLLLDRYILNFPFEQMQINNLRLGFGF